MNILVTGGAGFIASHITDRLISAGHRVVVIDNLSSGSMENLNPNVVFHKLDIRDANLKGLFESEGFEAIYHLAGQMDVRYSVRHPLEDMDINIRGSLNLIALAKEFGVKKFIFSSTGGAVYGEQEVFPAPEEHPTMPMSPYGITKLSIEKYLYFYFNEFGINTTVLRFANVYGPRQSPSGEAGVVAIFSHKMLRGDQAVIYGDGLQTRDYVYVGDIADAAFKALDLEKYNLMNLGTGIETNVVELYDLLAVSSGCKLPPKFADPLPGEQRRSVIDNRRALSLMGWSPKVSLEQGLSETLDFFRKKIADPSHR